MIPIATCSPKNADRVKGYGAEATFDYHEPDCVAKIASLTPHSQIRLQCSLTRSSFIRKATPRTTSSTRLIALLRLILLLSASLPLVELVASTSLWIRFQRKLQHVQLLRPTGFSDHPFLAMARRGRLHMVDPRTMTCVHMVKGCGRWRRS